MTHHETAERIFSTAGIIIGKCIHLEDEGFRTCHGCVLSAIQKVYTQAHEEGRKEMKEMCAKVAKDHANLPPCNYLNGQICAVEIAQKIRELK